MATYTYNHAVKINGNIIPPNTAIECEEKQKTDETPVNLMKEATEAEKIIETTKKSARRKKAE